jgi:hypothetical protein
VRVVDVVDRGAAGGRRVARLREVGRAALSAGGARGESDGCQGDQTGAGRGAEPVRPGAQLLGVHATISSLVYVQRLSRPGGARVNEYLPVRRENVADEAPNLAGAVRSDKLGPPPRYTCLRVPGHATPPALCVPSCSRG